METVCTPIVGKQDGLDDPLGHLLLVLRRQLGDAVAELLAREAVRGRASVRAGILKVSLFLGEHMLVCHVHEHFLDQHVAGKVFVSDHYGPTLAVSSIVDQSCFDIEARPSPAAGKIGAVDILPLVVARQPTCPPSVGGELVLGGVLRWGIGLAASVSCFGRLLPHPRMNTRRLHS